ncbi:MAG: hypothetical protein ACT4P8_22210 [Betaproteobacteria bacterium]
MSGFGKVAVLMGGRAGLGAAARPVRAGAQGRPQDTGVVECGG